MECLSSRLPRCLSQRLSRWSRATLLAAACATLAGGHAQAQLYKWVDENGKTHYSDTMPANAVDRARKEIRADGVVKSSIDRALTPEEKRQAALKAAEDEKLRTAQSERERKDKALLATYMDLKDFDRVRDRTLSALDNEINSLSAGPAAAPSASASAPAPASAASASSAPVAKAAGAVTGRSAASADAGQAAAQAAQQQRLAQAVEKKRRERADLAAQYEAERARLASLLAAERSSITPVSVPATRK